MREHIVKCWPSYYDAVESGEKPFDVRLDDRGYQKGDVLKLQKFEPGVGYHFDRANPGKWRECTKVITYVLTGGRFGIEPGYVVLGLAAHPTRGD